MSGRQRARICSDFCGLADAKPTCAAEKAPDSLERAPTSADATRGRTALRSERELVGASRSENHNLKVDRFQGVRSAELIVCGKPLLSIIALHPGHTSCVLLREARVRGTACRVPTERIGRAC